MPNRVIAVTGGKGGVGKSTTTVNLGVSLRMDGHSVVLVDADVEMPNLVELLGIEPEHTIHDVLGGDLDPTDALVELGPDFAVVPGDSSLSSYGAIEPERLQTVVDTLADAYEFVLLDTGAGLSYDDLVPMGLADEIVLVSSPDPAAIENAKRTQEFVRRLGRQIRGVVITKADVSVDGTVAQPFDSELLGVIPEDQAVRLSTAAGKPIELYAPNSSAAQAYRQLEANLTDGVLPPQRSDQSAGPAAAERETPSSSPSEPAETGAGTDDADRREVEGTEAGRPGLLARLVRFVT